MENTLFTYMRNSFIILIGSFVCSLAIWSCKQKTTFKSSPDTIRVNGLQLSASTPVTADRIQYNGTLQADKTIDLSFQVSGTITAMPVQTGDYVSKGQLVATVDETVYRNQYNAQLAQAKLAEENYNRILAVFNKGSIAEIKMLQARSDFDQATSAAKATYQNIVHCKLYAPESGYIGDKKTEAGATASPGLPIIQLLNISSVKVLVSVPEKEINQYKAGDLADVIVDALGEKPLVGKVAEIGVLAQQNSASYNVKVNLVNPTKALKPGMLCKVTFHPKSISSKDTSGNIQIIVPAQAVQVDEQGKNFVFIVDETGKKALRRTVQTGALYNSGIVINGGLSGNEQLITSGYQKLSDSTPVIINK